MSELVVRENALEMYMNVEKYEQLGRVANALAKSALLPEAFRNKPENVFIALQIAARVGIDPFMAMTNIYIVKGNPTMSAKLMISLANRSGCFQNQIVFTEKGEGDAMACTATVKLLDGQTVTKTVTMAQAKNAGWTANPIWKSQPGQMLAYRAASQLIRLYAAEAILGMNSFEEMEDYEAALKIPKKNEEANAVLKSLAEEEKTVETSFVQTYSDEKKPILFRWLSDQGIMFKNVEEKELGAVLHQTLCKSALTMEDSKIMVIDAVNVFKGQRNEPKN